MPMFLRWSYVVLVVVFVAGQQCSGNAVNCLEKEKSLGVLDFARQSIEKAEDLFPHCFDSDDSTNSSVCRKKEKALAFLQIAKDLIAKAEKNYPTCLDVNTTVLPDVTTTILPDVTTTALPDVTTAVLPNLTTTAVPILSPMDCNDVLKRGHKTSGVYKVWPRSPLMKNTSISVYCDMETDGGGWTVMQRRGGFSPLRSFNQSWKSYKTGFGELNGEFWLGNDNIYAITNQAAYEARIDLKDFEGNKKYAVYKTFRIENESARYKLHAKSYSGNAGDSLKYDDGNTFGTYDNDNKKSTTSTPCAISRGAGWWFNDCVRAHINGIPNKTANPSNTKNLYWKEWKVYQSLATANMKLRRI